MFCERRDNHNNFKLTLAYFASSLLFWFLTVGSVNAAVLSEKD